VYSASWRKSGILKMVPSRAFEKYQDEPFWDTVWYWRSHFVCIILIFVHTHAHTHSEKET
jgi:hypothetical protein